jgi:arsenate reductase
MYTILVLCTGNSCRSILGEALINKMGQGRFKALSAGSHPVGKVNPNALLTLEAHGLDTSGYSSQSWDAFEDQAIDIVITVCDNAAGETCPVYLNSAIRAHWGLPDPAHVTGTEEEIKSAFENTYQALVNRIQKMLDLPINEFSSQEVETTLNEIGRIM